MNMNKSDPQTITPTSRTPKKFFSFTKNNNPDSRYFVYEIWEDKMPDKVIAGEKLENIDERTLSSEQLDKMIPFFRQMAVDKNLKHPILSIQVDLENGSEIAYGYTNGRKDIPPNAQAYIIKPMFDDNITLMRHGGEQGKSLVYHSPLESLSLREELENFNTLISRFFNGGFDELLNEHSDKSTGWEFRNEVIVDNTKLRKSK